MKEEQKKDAIKMLMKTANDDLGINYGEFIELAQRLYKELRPQGGIEFYKETSPGLYKKV
ncbi:hypothetical protein [Halonatronum saccharophilum]|uniref:hypothetical protein n=1 Tax=Halonatronum saccharophilum TaxID=150060 RepID=UPI0004832D1A|nr:hypothetical protein [Halonatronum saccharophilum]